MLKKGFLTGLLLFGMFFGASNLIYPPELGLNAGAQFGVGMLGFIISGVGIAMVGLMLGLLNASGFRGFMEERFPKWAALSILVLLYLTIGPFFAIPRTAAVSYEIGVLPMVNNLLGTESGMAGFIVRFIFMALYFGFGLWIALNPSKILSRIGKIMTPIFALLILLIAILGFFKYGSLNPSEANEAYQASKAFGSGFLAGYNTLDTLASVAFSVVALNTLKTFGFKSKKEYFSTVWVVGALTALGFSILYIGLGYLGNHMPINMADFEAQKMNMGAYILTTASRDIFGWFGQLFLGCMVVLTCFTTMVGLVVATSEFFEEIWPRFTYKQYVVVFSIIGFILGNAGLSTVVKFSVPILVILYPIIMMIIVIIICNKFVGLSKLGMNLSLAVVTLISIGRVISDTFGVKQIGNLLGHLPLYNESLEWLVPGLVVLLIGLVVGPKFKSAPFQLEWLNAHLKNQD